MFDMNDRYTDLGKGNLRAPAEEIVHRPEGFLLRRRPDNSKNGQRPFTRSVVSNAQN